MRLESHKDASKVKKFTLASFGKKLKTAPVLKAQGAEAKSLIDFTIDTLNRFEDKLGQKGQLLSEAGECLHAYYHVLNESERTLDDATCQRLFDLGNLHVQLYKKAGCRMVPKHHVFMHTNASTPEHGSPKWYSTYEDESENGLVARTLRSVHRMTFSLSFFEKVEVHLYRHHPVQ